MICAHLASQAIERAVETLSIICICFCVFGRRRSSHVFHDWCQLFHIAYFRKLVLISCAVYSESRETDRESSFCVASCREDDSGRCFSILYDDNILIPFNSNGMLQLVFDSRRARWSHGWLVKAVSRDFGSDVTINTTYVRTIGFGIWNSRVT